MTETAAQQEARLRAEALAEAKRRDYDATFRKIVEAGQAGLDKHDPRKSTEQENDHV